LATAAALQFYAIGLLGYSVVRIASPAFYALEQNRIPVAISIVTVLVNAGLNTILVRWMGYEGLALGTSVAALLNAGLLLLMLVQMFPGILAITAIYTVLKQIGDTFSGIGLGTIWGLTLVYLGGALGVNTFLMKGYFDTIPVDIDESARIDGAGHTRIFFGLIMRLATPILIVVFFVTFQSTFNELAIASVVMPASTNNTAAVGLNSLVSNPLIQNWGMMAAGGLMMAIPLFALFLATQKYLVTGLTAGAVKG